MTLVLISFWENRTRSEQPSLAYPDCKKSSCFPESAHPENPPLLSILYHRNLLGLERESQLLFNCQPSMNINCFVFMGQSPHHKGLDVVHYHHRAVFITETCSYSMLSAWVCVCALSGGLSVTIAHIVLHVWHSSVSHQRPSSTINHENPLCLAKSQWAASITEPALPIHEYFPNETLFYRNTDLKVRGKKLGCTATWMSALYLSLSLKYVQLQRGADSGERQRKNWKKERNTCAHWSMCCFLSFCM